MRGESSWLGIALATIQGVSMSKAETKILIGFLLVIGGAVLLSNPRCPRGCKTVAEHLLSHGLDDLIASVFA